MPWCTAYDFSNSSINNPEKNPIYYSKKWVHQKIIDTCFKPKRRYSCANSKLTSNQLSAERCSNVIVVLCTFKKQRVQSLIGALAPTDLTSSYCILDKVRSWISIASSMQFFVITVNDWESLDVVSKKSILVPAGVLDTPLLETEASKLNKHHINGRKFY